MYNFWKKNKDVSILFYSLSLSLSLSLAGEYIARFFLYSPTFELLLLFLCLRAFLLTDLACDKLQASSVAEFLLPKVKTCNDIPAKITDAFWRLECRDVPVLSQLSTNQIAVNKIRKHRDWSLKHSLKRICHLCSV